MGQLAQRAEHVGLADQVVALSGAASVALLLVGDRFGRGSDGLAVVAVAGGLLVAIQILQLAAQDIGLSSVAAIRYDVFPRWIRWFDIALLVVLALSLFPVGPTGLMAVLGISWFFVASLLFASDTGVADSTAPSS